MNEDIVNHLQGKYLINEIIGSGTYGVVHRGRFKDSNKAVAIKQINKNNLNKEVLRYLSEEIALLRKCQYQNIIQMYEDQETDQYIYIILEQCQMDLGTLADTYFNGKLPESMIVSILRQMISGLGYLHQNNIIHRDLKRENIMLMIPDELYKKCLETKRMDIDVFQQSVVKIIDFGVGKDLTESDRQLTRTIIGSPLSIAPEILEGHAYGIGADIYSLGVLLFNLISGTFPYKAQSLTQQLKLIQAEQIDISLLNVSYYLQDLIIKMLKCDPSKRLTIEDLKNSRYFQASPYVNRLELNLQQNWVNYSKNGNQKLQKCSIQIISEVDDIPPVKQEQQIQQSQPIDKNAKNDLESQFATQKDHCISDGIYVEQANSSIGKPEKLFSSFGYKEESKEQNQFLDPILKVEIEKSSSYVSHQIDSYDSQQNSQVMRKNFDIEYDRLIGSVKINQNNNYQRIIDGLFQRRNEYFIIFQSYKGIKGLIKANSQLGNFKESNLLLLEAVVRLNSILLKQINSGEEIECFEELLDREDYLSLISLVNKDQVEINDVQDQLNSEGVSQKIDFKQTYFTIPLPFPNIFRNFQLELGGQKDAKRINSVTNNFQEQFKANTQTMFLEIAKFDGKIESQVLAQIRILIIQANKAFEHSGQIIEYFDYQNNQESKDQFIDSKVLQYGKQILSYVLPITLRKQ